MGEGSIFHSTQPGREGPRMALVEPAAGLQDQAGSPRVKMPPGSAPWLGLRGSQRSAHWGEGKRRACSSVVESQGFPIAWREKPLSDYLTSKQKEDRQGTTTPCHVLV